MLPPEAEQRAALEGLMDLCGCRAFGRRAREEIIDRLMEQAAEAAAVRLDKGAVKLIDRMLSVKGSAHRCITPDADAHALSAREA